MRATPLDYYAQDTLNEHRCGDIWSELPTSGALPLPTCPGIVVTPACDLDNCKTETITYLPIVPVEIFLASAAVARRVKTELRNTIGPALLASLLPPPLSDDTLLLTTTERERLARLVADNQSSLGDSRARKAKAALRILLQISKGASAGVVTDLKEVLGAKGFSTAVEEIVCNKRADTHFLPGDGQPEAYGVLSSHSVALLRYPASVPLELLECARSDAGAGWRTLYADAPYLAPSLRIFGEMPPIKRGRLREAFLKDLVSRYVGTFGRLGSPDFSPALVAEISAQIGA